MRETCICRILFVTIAFDLGIDCNNVRRVIQIGAPHTMEDYYKKVGLAVSQGRYQLQLLQYRQIQKKKKKNMSDGMKNFVRSKQCKRKMILSYFDHDVPNNQDPAHICCDFHSRQCRCDDCEFALALADIDVDIP